jgi:serine/threonine-protein kinase
MQTQTTVTAGYDPAALLTPPPATIGRFTVVGEIGRGANGVVYAARDPVLGRDVAIKAIPLTVNDKVRERAEANFIKEARAAAGLNHPHIVTIFDAGKTDTLAYIAMERLHGRDLHEYLYVGSRLGVRQAAALMARIADAVHYAHKRGLIHRDIKPSNIFLSREMKPKVLDFGVAMPRSERNPSQHSQLIGTPNYMSPEQARGEPIDGRSDVFSLGTILYEMITGKRAFDAPNVDDLLVKLIRSEPEPVTDLRPDAPPELVRIINKALAKDIDARYQTAGDLRNDLAAFAGSREMDVQEMRGPATGATSLAPAWRRRPLWAGIAAVAVFAATVLWWMQRDTQAPLEQAVILTPRPPVVSTPPAAPVAPPPAIAAPVEPASAARKPAVAAPPAEGLVTLAIAPWGEVLVNGEPRGVSPPLTKMSLPPGSYAIEVRNGDAPPLKTNIEIKPGQTQTLRHRF